MKKKSSILQENRQEVIFNILDRVPVEKLDSFMRGFFKTLLIRENLNADTIISEYISVSSKIFRTYHTEIGFSFNAQYQIFRTWLKHP